MTVTLTQEERNNLASISPERMAALEAEVDENANAAPRYWRDELSPAKLAGNTPEELCEIIHAMARHSDIMLWRQAKLIKAVHQAIDTGKSVDTSRKNYFGFIEIQSKILSVVGRLDALNDLARREALIRAAIGGLAGVVGDGCPPIPWPDASIFEKSFFQMPLDWTDVGAA